MRLIDADKAKAELLAIAETIPAWPGFFDGIRSGYQSAADRLDTMLVVEERKHGHWIELEPDKYGNFTHVNPPNNLLLVNHIFCYTSVYTLI